MRKHFACGREGQTVQRPVWLGVPSSVTLFRGSLTPTYQRPRSRSRLSQAVNVIGHALGFQNPGLFTDFRRENDRLKLTGTAIMSSANPYDSAASGVPTAQVSLPTRILHIKRIDVLSVAKLLGAFYALLGLIVGGFFSVVAVVGAVAGGGDAALGGIIGGIGAIVLMPVLYGILGFVGGAIAAFLYNVVASIAGGVVLEIET